jgi:hypothetical protein
MERKYTVRLVLLLRKASFVFATGFLSFSLLPSVSTQAQNSASVYGTVKSVDETLAGATVIIKNESTGFQVGTVTNPNGTFLANQIPLGGPYTLTAQMVGYGTLVKTGFTLRIGERLRVDFELAEKTEELQTVTVTAQDEVVGKVSPLGASTRLGTQEVRHLPIANRSFQDLAILNPVSGPGGNALALGGTRESSTAITLDGTNLRYMMNGGLISQYTVSMEAIKEYQVTNNDYDVMQGRQGGGSVNVITKQGTNSFTGSAFLFNRSKQVLGLNEVDGTRDVNFINQPIRDFNFNQYGFSLGGPIIKDKLHFFTALDFEDRKENLFIVDLSSPQAESIEQISSANLNRFLTILQTQYGTDPNQQQVGQFVRNTQNRTVFGRLDWHINNKHQLTLRSNVLWGYSPLTVAGDQTAIFEAYGNTRISSTATMLSLRSNLSSTLSNELKVQYLSAQRDFEPNTRAPRGFVSIQSRLGTDPAAPLVSRQFQFGGNRIAPEEQGERQIQLVDNLYLQKGKFFFNFGTDNILTLTNTLNTNEQGGLFQFANLDSLERQAPTLFTRLAPLNPQANGFAPFLRSTALDLSAYGQVTFDLMKNVNVSAGLRYDATAFLNRPAANPLVEQTVDRSTNVIGGDWNNIQPRLQVNWDIFGDQKSMVRFGAGAFAANIVHWAQLSNILQTGTNLTDISIVENRNTVQREIPRPDFVQYRQNPLSVPGAPASGPLNPPYINLIGENFQAPVTWKGNLAFRQFFAKNFYAGFNAYYARTVNNYIYQDLNLRSTPAFTLANEAGRPVFAPVSDIIVARTTDITNTPAVFYPIPNPRSVNQDPSLGRVLELNGASDVWQHGIIFEAGVVLPKGGSISASYTINRTEDNNSYNCCIARTSMVTAIAGDPRNLAENRGGANTDFRNKIIVFGTSPKLYGFRIGFRYVGQGGSPWSPVVLGDITGEGTFLQVNNNKRAFVFDPTALRNTPNATPYELELANGMDAVLNNPNNTAVDLLRDNLGKIAPRNEIYNPMWHLLDVRVSYTLDSKAIPALGKNSLEVLAEVFNIGNLFDSNAGFQKIVPGGNQILLETLGLDPAALQQGRTQYAYRARSNFGQEVRTGTPYQVQLGIRYTFN